MKISVRSAGEAFYLVDDASNPDGRFKRPVTHGIAKEHIAEELAEAFNTRREVLEAVLVLSDDYVDSNVSLVEQVRVAREEIIKAERRRILDKLNASPILGLTVPLTEDDLL